MCLPLCVFLIRQHHTTFHFHSQPSPLVAICFSPAKNTSDVRVHAHLSLLVLSSLACSPVGLTRGSPEVGGRGWSGEQTQIEAWLRVTSRPPTGQADNQVPSRGFLATAPNRGGGGTPSTDSTHKWIPVSIRPSPPGEGSGCLMSSALKAERGGVEKRRGGDGEGGCREEPGLSGCILVPC